MSDEHKTTPKPLFVPLAARWFEAFASGAKTEEYRPYGPRWNERTCEVGRAVTLSYGYGKARRLHGHVEGFRVVGPDADPAIPQVYPGLERIAAIKVRLA